MPSAKDHGRLVLAGIIPARLDLLQEAMKSLTAEHFVDGVQSRIFQFLEFYFQTTGGVLTSIAIKDLLDRSSADPGRKALYEESYEDMKALKVDDADFIWSVHVLREEFAESQMKSALTDTMEILQKGLEQERGEPLKGHEDAREYLMAKITDLETSINGQDTPHGDVKDEASVILREYQNTKEAQASGHKSGIQFGIEELDAKVGGLQRGDLGLVVAYSNDGKTTLCTQLAWSAAVEQGKNVLFFTTETVNVTVRRRLVARHSKHRRWADHGLPEGLNSKDIKAGTLNPHEEEFLAEVVADLTTNPEYGHIYIYQLPNQAGMREVEQIMYSVQKKFDIDLVICDTLQLLRPNGTRSTDRESMAGVIKNAKQVSVSFNKGRGVCFVSPWQVNRAAKEHADNTGRYSTQGLAETAEATNTPDIIVSVLAPIDNTDRYANVISQVLKHRDGETAADIQLAVDYATCHFSSKGTLESFGSASFTTGGGGLDDLI
jgi:replicative DNA helicase